MWNGIKLVFSFTWFFFLLLFPLNQKVFSEEFPNYDQNYISKNAQLQLLIAKTFLEEDFESAEGFYDPRIGIVLYLQYKNEIDCTPESLNPNKAECVKEKIQKVQFLLNVRKMLLGEQRVFLYIDYTTGNKLEIWKREFLNKLAEGNISQDTKLPFAYVHLVNGKHPTLGEYPNWNKIQEIIQKIQEKFISMGMESANGFFIPGKGFVFLIKTNKIPVRKVSKFNKKLIQQLQKFNLSAQYMIQYFYGGDRGELSNFIRIENGKNNYLKFWNEN